MMQRYLRSTLFRSLAAGALVLAALSACGGGSSSLPPAGGTGAPSNGAVGRVVQKLSLLIPANGFANDRRAPQYTSIATKGIGISLVLQGASAPSNPATLLNPDVAIDLTTTPISIVGDLGPNGEAISCAAVTTPQPGQQCTLSLSLPTDVSAIVVNAWDTAPASGTATFTAAAQLLSSATAAVTVASGSPGPTLSIVLDGIPASLTILPATSQTHFVLNAPGGATAPASYTEIGASPVALTIDALDADGNIIIGNGAPTVQWQATENGSAILSGSTVSGSAMNFSLAPFLTTATAFKSSFAFTATATRANGSPLATSIAIEPAQEFWVGGNIMLAGTTGRGPQALSGQGAILGYEIPPPTGSALSPVQFNADSVPMSSIVQCPNVLGSPAPFNFPADIMADPSGDLWILVNTPYSSSSGSGTASCVEEFALQPNANPPQAVANSMRTLSSVDNITGCVVDRFDTLWCVDATADKIYGYNLLATGSAPFSTPNVTLSLSLPPAGAATTPIAIALQPGGTNLWLAMAASAVGTSTTTTFYAREIPITSASSSAPSLGTPSNWAPFGSPYVSTDVAGSAIPVPDPPLAVDANDNIYSVDVGNETAGPTQAPLIAMWQPSLGGGNLSFGSPPNASAPYPFPGSGTGSSNPDEPFAIAPDGTLWVGDQGSYGFTPYTVSSGTLAVNTFLNPVPAPPSPPFGITISP